ncbi:MAG: hypothetical protein ACTHMS_16005 [Jatrophihabitans sp.]|uniref:hypothetical protein n=1 Tax=Jatrophihabitans sp. TaxID=1932789 RepID=UPI003F7E458C
MMLRSAVAAVVVLVGTVGTVAACSSSGGASGGASSTSAAAPAATSAAHQPAPQGTPPGASRLACEENVKTVEIAAEAYFARFGSHAPTLAAIVRAGFLRETPSSPYYVIHYRPHGDASPTVTGTLTSGSSPC